MNYDCHETYVLAQDMCKTYYLPFDSDYSTKTALTNIETFLNFQQNNIKLECHLHTIKFFLRQTFLR